MAMTPQKQCRKNARMMVILLALGMSAMLTACAWDSPTHVTTQRAEVYSDGFSIERPTDGFDQAETQKIGRHYWRYGNGPAHVTVTYDPQSSLNTAMKARQNSLAIGGLLKEQGIRAVETEILPIHEGGDQSITIITYNTIYAQAPSGCGETLNMSFADSKKLKDYQFGCSVETYLAKQIARPADLQGRTADDPGEARRAANMTESYMDYEPNEALEGEVASEQ